MLDCPIDWGKLNSLTFCIDSPNGYIGTTSLMLGANTIAPTSTIGDQTCYTIMASNDAANFGGDGLLCNTESITLTRNYAVDGCDAPGVTQVNTYSVNYNCTPVDTDCQSASGSGTGNFNFAFGSPLVTHSATILQNGTTCMDHIIETTFTNTGSGDLSAATLFNADFRTGLAFAIGEHESIDWSATNVDLVIDDMNTTTPLIFTGGDRSMFGEQEVMADLSQLGSDVDGTGGLSDEDGDGQFDDLVPGESITIITTWTYNCPDVCDQPNDARDNSYIGRLLYEDQCGDIGSRNVKTGTYFRYLRITQSSTSVVSPINVNEGEVTNAEAQVAMSFREPFGCEGSGVVTAVFETPAGFRVADTPNYTFNGSPTTGTISNDSVRLEGLFAGSGGQLDFGVDLLLEDCGLITSNPVKVPFTYTYACPGCPDCDVVFACDTLEIGVFCPGPCPEGGLTTTATDFKRTTLGFTDKNATMKVDENTLSTIQLKRFTPCDTAKLTVSTVQTPGNTFPTGADNAYIQFVYNEPGGSRLYQFVDGTFTLHDASTATTSLPMALPIPSETDLNDQHIITWDFSSALPSGSVIADGDSLSICANFVVLNNTSLPSQPEILSASVATFNIAEAVPDPLPDGSPRITCGGALVESYPFRYVTGNFLSSEITPNGCGGSIINFDFRLISNFSSDPFPNEIRPAGIIDSFVIDLGTTGFLVDPSRTPTLTVFGDDTGLEPSYGMPFNITLDEVNEPRILIRNDANEFMFGDDQGYNLKVPLIPNCSSSGTGEITINTHGYIQTANLERCEPFVVQTQRSPGTNALATFLLDGTTLSKVGDEKVECFEISLRNTNNSRDGAFVFFEFEDATSGMNVVSATHLTTNAASVDTALVLLSAADGQWIQFAEDFPAAELVTVEVCVTYDNCSTNTLVVNQGFDCAAYPSDPDDLLDNECTPETINLTLNPVDAVVQGQLTLQEGMSDICQTHTYELLVTSAGAANLIEPSVLLDLPTGLTFVDAEIAYPYDASLDSPTGYTGTFEMATPIFSTTMDSVTIILGDNSIVNDSLPGSNTEQTGQGTIEDRQAIVRFNFISDCDFVSASRIPFQINGFDPCGDALTPTNLLSAPLVLNGVTEELDVAIALTLPDSEIDCGSTTIAPDLTYIDTNSDGNPYVTGATDTVRVTLPAGVMYVTSSYMPDDANAPTFAGVEMDGASQVLILEVPSGVSVPDLGSVMTGFEFDITLDLSSSTCGASSALTINYEQTLGALFCTIIGMDCMNGAKTNLGSNFTTLSFQKSEVTNLLITSSNAVEIVGTFDLAGADLPMGESITLEAFCSDDPMMTTPIGSVTINGPITSGTTVPYTISTSTDCGPDQLGYVAAGPTTSGGADQCVCDDIVSQDILLPVELISFKGYSKDCATELQWQTASETNNAYFEVEYSEDAKVFKALERITGAGMSLVVQNYSYVHENTLATTAYYRLKQVDFDGTAAYSEVITVERDCEAAQQLEVYPIPVGQGQELQVRYYNEQENANLQIFDMNGRIIKRIPSISKGWNQIELNISELSNGVYYLVSDTGITQRFVVVE